MSFSSPEITSFSNNNFSWLCGSHGVSEPQDVVIVRPAVQGSVVGY